MEIDTERYEYLERLSDRRIEVQSLLIDLGKIGALLHPFKVIKLKKEAKRLDVIDCDISKMSFEFHNLLSKNVFYSSGVSDFVIDKNLHKISILEDTMRNYMENNPIGEEKVFIKRRVKALR